jgi:predicted nucleotidyltransferase
MSLLPQNQLSTLALLFAHPGQEFALTEIGDALGKRPGVFQRGVNALEKEGVLRSRKRGNQRLVSVNENYPFIAELRAIVGKTAGVEGLLRDLVMRHPAVEAAAIFGSYAADRLRADSDIDLLLVVRGANLEDALIDQLDGIEKKIARQVNYKAYSLDEYDEKKRGGDPFLHALGQGPLVVLKGSL